MQARGAPSASRPRPVQGAVAEVTIEALDPEGRGTADLQGFPVAVERVAPGERVRIRIVHVGRRGAHAIPLQVLVPSADRVTPPCSVFGRCGGCQWQHLAYPAQLAAKRQRVREALAAAGFPGVDVAEPLALAEPWGFRGKAQLPIGHARGRLVLGLYAAGSHRIIDVHACPVQHPTANAVLQAVRALLPARGVAPWREAGVGCLRHVLVRVAQDGRAHVVLVAAHADWDAAGFAAALVETVPAVGGVALNVNADPGNVVLGAETRPLAGSEALVETVDGVTLAISPTAFFQVTPGLVAGLYRAVCDAAAPGPGTVLVDAYAGVGAIACLAARAGATVHAIEWEAAAAADARRNAAALGADGARVTVHAAPAEEAFARLAADGVRPDAIVLDPPRSGCTPAVLAAAAGLRPGRIVYVSCDPATLARDAARLAALRYPPDTVQPVDLFPHTPHVECVARCPGPAA